MTLRQRFEFRQKAIFTQTLQQSVKILELPLLELKETIEKEIEDNPVVEEVSQDPALTAAPQAPSASEARESAADDEPGAFEDREITPKELSSYEKPIPGRKESLMDVLMRQLRINAGNEEDARIGSVIIHHIDANGYLRESPEAIAQEANCSPQDVDRVLKLIQTFDPSGVGGRDLKECLLIQLHRSGLRDALLETLITHHLEDLTSADLTKLCKKCKCTQEQLSQSFRKIQHLEPKPGRRFFDEEIAYVIPDINIEEKDGHLTIAMRDDVLPVVRVSPRYKAMLKSKKVPDETKDFIRQRMLSANNLIRAIKQRQDTLFKVVSVIVEVQSEALCEGMDYLKPLAFKEIAERVNLHESTISRVVMNKHTQTPRGIFALKEFFSNRLKTEEGEDVSSQRIKLKIQELVENEDKAYPLRDQKIAELIQESERIQLARRTVAKYREILNIPSVAKRRSRNVLLAAAH